MDSLQVKNYELCGEEIWNFRDEFFMECVFALYKQQTGINFDEVFFFFFF